MEDQLIALYEKNCAVCASYLAMKNDLNKKGFRKKYCPGCLLRNKNCTFMAKQCDMVGKGLVRFCYECEKYPCHRLKILDKRYRTKYHMSIIENLDLIKANGMGPFPDMEKKK